MEQFWETMAYRQECSAGRLVGFIWVVFQDHQGQAKETHEQQIDANSTVLSATIQSQVGGSVNRVPVLATANPAGLTLPGSPPLSAPVLPPHETDTLEAGNPVAEAAEQYYDDNQTLPINWPSKTRGELLVSAEQYDTLIDHLLQLDFSTRADGEKGTSSFITKGAELAGTTWGQTIIGRTNSPEGTRTTSLPQEVDVNILTGIRKKRKVDVVEEKSAPPQPMVNTLTAGLLRKKAKT
jgi:regulator of Ty1 transposition protein 109